MRKELTKSILLSSTDKLFINKSVFNIVNYFILYNNAKKMLEGMYKVFKTLDYRMTSKWHAAIISRENIYDINNNTVFKLNIEII